jgi:hypothetical protein
MYPQTKKPVGMLGVLCNSRYKGSHNWLCGSTSSAQSVRAQTSEPELHVRVPMVPMAEITLGPHH